MLSINALRQLIKEVFNETQRDKVFQQLSDQAYEYFMSLFNPGTGLSRDDWEQQVAKATDDFQFLVKEPLENIEQKLMRGDYSK